MSRLLKRFPFVLQLMRRAARLVSGRYTAGVVGVVVDARGRILLVEHAFHKRAWGLPGGWLQAGEPPADGLAREIAEETGLHIEVLDPLLIDVSPHQARHLDIALLCAARGDVTALSGELLDYDWVPLQDVPRLVDFHQAAVDALRARNSAQEIPT